MSEQEESSSEKDLHSAEYRQRLLRKLNTLIAVLEVATAKVRRSLAGPSPDVERLLKIKKNLQNTLDVCQRAKTALEKHATLPKELSRNLADVVNEPALKAEHPAPRGGMPPGTRYEMLSWNEHLKFRRMGPVRAAEWEGCDLDELSQRLQA